MELTDLITDAPFGFIGQGAQINIFNDELSKYSLFIPLETVSTPTGNVETIEHKPNTASSIGLIKGLTTLESKEIQFLWCRQNLDRIDAFLGKNNRYLITYPDGTGWKFDGEHTYRPDDTDVTNKTTGTLTIIPTSASTNYIPDVSDIFAKTCLANNMNVSKIKLSSSHLSESINLQLSNASGTISAKSNNSKITASVSDKKVTISVSAAAATTGIVYITTSASGEASWTYPVYVMVEA